MTINAELASKISTIISLRPGVHDQSTWFYSYTGSGDTLSPEDIHIEELLAEVQESEEKGIDYKDFEPVVSCQATLCVAGWACILEGYTLLEDDNRDIVAEKNGVRTKVQEKGAELLGLDNELATWLFCSTDDEEAEEALEALSDGEVPDAFRYENDNYCCSDCDGY